MMDEQLDTIEWLGLRLKVPVDWEIVRHAVSVERGSLVLVDRRRERMELFWQRMTREPDLGRMVADHRSRELETEPRPELTELRTPTGWRGLLRTSPKGEVVSRAIRFDAPSGRLVEAVIVHPLGTSGGAEWVRRLLARIEVVAAAEAATRWNAFSLRVTTPPGFGMAQASVKPGDVCFEFHPIRPGRREPGPERVSIRRMGLASAWFDGDHEKLIRREAPRVAFRCCSEARQGRHRGLSAEGHEPGQPLARLVGRGLGRRVLVWRCEEENAVYRIQTTSRRLAIHPEDFRVLCCGGASHG